MKIKTLFITILLVFALACGDLFAQKSKSTSFYRGRYKNIKITRAKARIVCPIFEESKYPYQGVGIKLGDPLAFTYKFYGTKNFAIALDFGSAASGLYSKYHRNKFDNFTQEDTLTNNQSIGYLGHIVNNEWVFEGKVLLHNEADDLMKGLQWYIGAGWQWRKTEVEYEYLLDISFDESEIGKFTDNYLTMGPTGVFGIEYAYFTLPVSVFIESEVYFDVVNDPGWMRFQAGMGIRYVF